MKYEKYSIVNTICYYIGPFMRSIRTMVLVSIGMCGILFAILFALNYIW